MLLFLKMSCICMQFTVDLLFKKLERDITASLKNKSTIKLCAMKLC